MVPVSDVVVLRLARPLTKVESVALGAESWELLQSGLQMNPSKLAEAHVEEKSGGSLKRGRLVASCGRFHLKVFHHEKMCRPVSTAAIVRLE